MEIQYPPFHSSLHQNSLTFAPRAFHRNVVHGTSTFALRQGQPVAVVVGVLRILSVAQSL